jgi:hypothetical protein
MITITPVVHSIGLDTIMFEEDFGTVSFTSTIRLDFSNPMHEDFLSGQAFFAVRASLEPYITNQYEMSFALTAD